MGDFLQLRKIMKRRNVGDGDKALRPSLNKFQRFSP